MHIITFIFGMFAVGSHEEVGDDQQKSVVTTRMGELHSVNDV